MTLRLFALRNVSTKRLVPDLFFADKPAAKLARDTQNKDAPGTHCVTFGPDHRRFTT